MGAPAANAALLVASAKNCSPQPTSKVFAPWGDQLDYQLAPGGSFEVGDEALEPEPRPVVGLRERAVEGAWRDRHALGQAASGRIGDIPGHVRGTDPERCFDSSRRNNSALLSTLTVEATIQTSLGLQATVPDRRHAAHG